MFERIKNWWKGATGRMFPITTLKRVVGDQISLTPKMVNKIEMWAMMYAGNANWCEEPVHSLRLEQGIVREFANVTLNEMDTCLLNGKLDQVYQAGIRDLNEGLQAGLAKGAFIIKPLGTTGAVQYVTQDMFIPLEFDSRGRLRKVVMLDTRRISKELYYIRFEFHIQEKGMMVIRNKVYQSSDGQTVGAEVGLQVLDDWKTLPEEIGYPIDYVDFGYYRNPIDNTIDNSKCGVSIFDAAADVIRKADIQFGRIDWEYESGERAIYADVTAIGNDKKTGKDRISKLNNRLFKRIDTGKDDFFEDFSPEMRDDAYIRGLEEYKRDIEFIVGLAYGDLSKVSEVEKTAEEIKTSKQRKYNTVKAIQGNLYDCLEDFAKALAFYNGMTGVRSEFKCDFKDSILVDEEKERQNDRADVAAGFMQPWEYRAKWYNEDEATAKAMVAQEADVVEE